MKVEMTGGRAFDICAWNGDSDLTAVNELSVMLDAASRWYESQGLLTSAKIARRAADQIYHGLDYLGFYDQLDDGVYDY